MLKIRLTDHEIGQIISACENELDAATDYLKKLREVLVALKKERRNYKISSESAGWVTAPARKRGRPPKVNITADMLSGNAAEAKMKKKKKRRKSKYGYSKKKMIFLAPMGKPSAKLRLNEYGMPVYEN